MRVLMTTDTIGGVWTYAIGLIAGLAPHGVQFGLASLGNPLSAAQKRQVEALSNLALFESRYDLEWMNDPWPDVIASGRWLLELEQAYRPDVVHLNGYAHGRNPFAAPVVMVAHSCCLSWWEAVKRESPPAFWNRYKHEVSLGLAGASVVVAPSRAMLSEIERIYQPGVPTAVIYNGRDRDSLGPTHKQNLILAAGRVWDEAKNIAALAKVANQVPWPIEVAGNPVHPDGTVGQTGGLELLGTIDPAALGRRMGQAAIYALPARYEPFGLSILEAALAGCALVLGDIPSLREIWADSAIYVNPESPDELVRALNRLIDHPAERARLAAQSTRRAARYTANAMTGQYAKLYRRLVNGSAVSLSNDPRFVTETVS